MKIARRYLKEGLNTLVISDLGDANESFAACYNLLEANKEIKLSRKEMIDLYSCYGYTSLLDGDTITGHSMGLFWVDCRCFDEAFEDI